VCSFSPKEEEEEGPSFPKPFISFCVSKVIYKVRVSLRNGTFLSFAQSAHNKVSQINAARCIKRRRRRRRRPPRVRDNDDDDDDDDDEPNSLCFFVPRGKKAVFKKRSESNTFCNGTTKHSLAAVLFDDDEDNGVLYHQNAIRRVHRRHGPLRRRVLRQLFSILRESVRERAENARRIWTRR